MSGYRNYGSMERAASICRLSIGILGFSRGCWFPTNRRSSLSPAAIGFLANGASFPWPFWFCGIECALLRPTTLARCVGFGDVLRVHEPLVQCSPLELKFPDDVLGGIHGWGPPPHCAMQDKATKDASRNRRAQTSAMFAAQGLDAFSRDQGAPLAKRRLDRPTGGQMLRSKSNRPARSRKAKRRIRTVWHRRGWRRSRVHEQHAVLLLQAMAAPSGTRRPKQCRAHCAPVACETANG